MFGICVVAFIDIDEHAIVCHSHMLLPYVPPCDTESQFVTSALILID